MLFCHKTLHVSGILLGSGRQTCMKLTSAECTVEKPLMMGTEDAQKHVQLYDKINLGN